MAGTLTPRLGLYKPAADESDNVNLNTDLNNNSDRLDALVGFLPCTSATRPADPYDGQAIRETDTQDAYVWDDSTGAWLRVMVQGQTTPWPGGVSVLLGPVQIGVTDTSGAGVNIGASGATVDILRARVGGDANTRVIIRADGRIGWGPGSAGVDTNLYRDGLDTLKTDDNFTVGLDLSVGDDLTVGDALSTGGAASIGGTLSVGGADIGKGLQGSDPQTSDSAAVSAETVVHTITSFVFKAGRAYRMNLNSGVSCNTANGYAKIGFRKTSAAGTDLGEAYRTDCGPTTNAVVNCDSQRVVRNTGGSDVTVTVVVTLAASTGTVKLAGSAATPRAFYIEDVGLASAWAWGVAV